MRSSVTTCFKFGCDFHLGEAISSENVESALQNQVCVCVGGCCFGIHRMRCRTRARQFRGTGVWYSNPIVCSNCSCSNSDVKSAQYGNETKLKPSLNGDIREWDDRAEFLQHVTDGRYLVAGSWAMNSDVTALSPPHCGPCNNFVSLLRFLNVPCNRFN